MAFTVDLPGILGLPIPQIQVLDVGAMETGQDRYQDLVVSGLARVTGFEPNPEQLAALQKRPGPYQYLSVCLGNGKPATFHRTRFPGCSSLLEPDPGVIDLFTMIGCADPNGNFHVQGTETIDTVRLDDLGADVVADFLKIDIQGAELEVMRHGTKKLASTLVIECEAEFVPLYRDQPLFGDIQCFLRDQGFVLHKLIDVSGRPFRPFAPPNPFLPMSQLLWADAIFVRDFSRLQSYSDEGLLKAVAILDIVYGSYDLATLLLQEFDRRSRSTLRQRYVDALGRRRLTPRCLNLMDRPQ